MLAHHLMRSLRRHDARRRAALVLVLAMSIAACESISDVKSACTAGSNAGHCTGGTLWPGDNDTRTVDAAGALGANVSGLVYEDNGSAPAVLWAVRNDPSTLLRLVASGGVWVSDPSGGWLAGRPLRYPDNSGNPDAEGVTFAGSGTSAGVYVAAERDNAASATSRNSILRYDVTPSTPVLRATHEWLLTNELPPSGANLGLEAISWMPDSMLVANAFVDASTNQLYRPSNYPDHGTGLFFVGLEADGNVYAFALNHATSTAKRVATIVTGFIAVMGMEYDRDTGALWIICDDHCGNTSAVLSLTTTSDTPGRFRPQAPFARPSTLPDVNNEGFALAPRSACVANRKPAFWADDDATAGHVLRTASVPCSAVGTR